MTTSWILDVGRLTTVLTEELVGALRLAPADAELTIEHLIRSEQLGRADHGLIRFPYLVTSGKFGPFAGEECADPEVLEDGTLHVEGEGALGYAVLHRLIEAGSQRALEQGLCTATSANIYPSGALVDWAHVAIQHGVGILMCANSPPRVAAPGTTEPVVGTDAFCLGFPADPYPIVVDCSLSEITHGNLLLAREASEPLPEHAAIDAAGKPARDASLVEPTKGRGALLPAGNSHKAFAIACAIEVLVALGGGQPGARKTGRHGVFCSFFGPQIARRARGAISAWAGELDSAGTRVPGWSSAAHAAPWLARGQVAIKPETAESIRRLVPPSALEACRVVRKPVACTAIEETL